LVEEESYLEVQKIIKTENEIKNAFNYVTMEFNPKFLNYEERICNQYLINNTESFTLILKINNFKFFYFLKI